MKQRLLVGAMICLAMLVSLHAQKPADDPEEEEDVNARSEWFFEQRAYPLGYIPTKARMDAVMEMNRLESARRAAKSAASSSDRWTLIGPQPTGAGTSVYSGHVAAVVADPRDPNVVYLGGADGGVWKSTDGGKNWTPLTDFQASLSIGALAIDPSNPGTIYAGTGNSRAGYAGHSGIGILKSTNGGASWVNIPGPFVSAISWVGIYSIAVHPANPQTLLAGSSTGIFRSGDGGLNWTQILPAVQGITKVLFEPVNGSVAYAAMVSRGVYVSVDGGLSWSPSNGTESNSLSLPGMQLGAVEVAIAPSNPSILYANITDTNETTTRFFRTADGGKNWIPIATPVPSCQICIPPTTGGPYCLGQCWFNNVMAVSPVDPDVVIAGGYDPYRTLDGGNTWSDLFASTDYLKYGHTHVDQHAVAFTKDGSKVYLGNDGGIWSTADVTNSSLNWTNLNETLSLTQFYPGMSIHPSDVTIAWGGTQDNSGQKYTGTLKWEIAIPCGDTIGTAVDFLAPANVYAACAGTRGLLVMKSTTGGGPNSYAQAVGGIDRSDRSSFAPPLTMDPSNPLRLYIGSYRIYQTTDGAGSWTAISPDLTGGQGFVNAIAVAPSDPGTVYAATDYDGRVYVTHNALAGRVATWSLVQSGLPKAFLTQVSVDPRSASTAYVTVSSYSSGHVFRTSDGGGSWKDISGNLPNAPANDLVVDPEISNTLYVATDVGVFRTIDGGLNWAPLGIGLPRSVVLSLKLHQPSRILRAATYGRSVWDLFVPLSSSNPVPTLNTLFPSAAPAGTSALTLTVSGSGFVPESTVLWNGSPRPTTFVSLTELRASISASDLSTAAALMVAVTSLGPGGGTSRALAFTVSEPPHITLVANAFGDTPLIAPNTWLEIKGTNLAPPGITRTWQTADFSNGKLPTQLDGVSVTVGGRPSYVYFVDPAQINILTPPDAFVSPAQVQVTVGSVKSNVATVPAQALSPSFFEFVSSSNRHYVYGRHADGSLIGPPGLFPAAPEITSPVKPGEAIYIAATGLGTTNVPIVSGSLSQSGTLPAPWPEVKVGDITASVSFAGLVSVGTYQINFVVPPNAPDGDLPLTATYKGSSIQPGLLITVKR